MVYVLRIASFADCFSSTIYLSFTMSHVLPPFSTLEQTKKRQSPRLLKLYILCERAISHQNLE